jgi:threonine dehydrogenase-like Zn-dependent dehydrogenase
MSKEKMLGFKLLGSEKSKMVEVEKPGTAPGEVLVKVISLALCGSCINLRYRPTVAESKERVLELGIDLDPASIPGHEMTGVIVDANNSRTLRNGDRVFIFPFIPSVNSIFYKDKLYKYSTPLKIVGYTIDGGNTEFLSVPEINCYVLPDYVTFEQGAMLLDPLGAPFGALSKLNANYLDTVLILGTGPIGLGATVICDFIGVKKIITVDIMKDRVELSRELGAEDILNMNQMDIHDSILELTNDRGPDVVLDCIGDKDSFNQSIKLVKPGGRVGIIGEPGIINNVSVSDIIIHKDILIKGSWVYDPEKLNDLYELIKNGLKIEKIITHKFNLNESEKAWKVFNTNTTGKVIINP